MRQMAHIINPVMVGPASDLFFAQPVTFETMRVAREFARRQVEVELFTAQYPEDRALVPEGFAATPDLERSVLDLRDFQHRRKLPLLADILNRLAAASDAEYFIYTNVDIALLPHFYTAVNALIEQGHDAFVINRRTISAPYHNLAEIPLMYAEAGQKHEGHDCFVFRRAVYSQYRLGAVCVGMPWVGRALIWNLVAQAQRFQEFKKSHLTFHLGNELGWQNEKYSDYCAHNKAEAAKAGLEIERQYGPFDGHSPFSLYPLDINVMNNA